MTTRQMYRCEVFLPRRNEWVTIDDTPEPTTQKTYEKELLKSFPVLQSRLWRVVPTDRKPAKTLFTLSVDL